MGTHTRGLRGLSRRGGRRPHARRDLPEPCVDLPTAGSDDGCRAPCTHGCRHRSRQRRRPLCAGHRSAIHQAPCGGHCELPADAGVLAGPCTGDDRRRELHDRPEGICGGGNLGASRRGGGTGIIAASNHARGGHFQPAAVRGIAAGAAACGGAGVGSGRAPAQHGRYRICLGRAGAVRRGAGRLRQGPAGPSRLACPRLLRVPPADPRAPARRLGTV